MGTYKEITWPGWEIVRRIGSGSFGTVYEIQRDIYGDIEKAALKVIAIPHNEDEVDYLRCSGLDDESITQTFHQQVGDIAKEYKLMAQLRENPNIVRCDDFRDIQHNDGLGWDIYIKMELLTPLMKCLDRVATEDQIVQMGLDICNALIDCQKKNIIHRDIKPQNVFISESGRFKLGDFGIARTIERTTHATAGIGTYSYMAPEVERNEPYGRTADIYSLGLMMYWLLNERRGPFMPLPPNTPKYGDEEQARRRRFAGEPIPPPKNGCKELKAIVLRACSFKPQDRFDSALEMFVALNSLAGKHPELPAVETISTQTAVFENEEATVGPNWEKNAESGSVSVHDLEDTGATVGPVFAKTHSESKVPVAHVQISDDNGHKPEATPKEYKQTGIALSNGSWKCACGRSNAAYVSSCACGVNKRDIILVYEQPAKKRLSPKAVAPKPWRCACGRTNAAYVSSCVCGINKRDIDGIDAAKPVAEERPLLQSDEPPDLSVPESSKVAPDESWRKTEIAHRACLKSVEGRDIIPSVDHPMMSQQTAPRPESVSDTGQAVTRTEQEMVPDDKSEKPLSPLKKWIGNRRFFAIVFSLLVVLLVATGIDLMLKGTCVASGKCGHKANWVLYDDGTLIVDGSGFVSTVGWNEHKLSIKKVVIKSGITNICAYAFADCKNLSSISIADSVRTIGLSSFANCSSLITVQVPEYVDTIAAHAFYNCRNLARVFVLGINTSVTTSSFEGTSATICGHVGSYAEKYAKANNIPFEKIGR